MITKKRIAIVGGGVAGLTAGYLLSRKHDVFMFEKQNRIGGNAFTYQTSDGLEVELAAAAFGTKGYPTFTRLLDELGVKTRPILTRYLSLHNLDTGKGIYLTPGARGLWAQKFKLLWSGQWLSFLKLLTGMHLALRKLNKGEFKDVSMEDALESIKQFRGQSDTWLILVCSLCLLSSMSAREVLDAPAEFFFGKLRSHSDAISPQAALSWRVVKGRTQLYVDRLAKPFRERITLEANIKTVRRSDDGVDIVFENGEEQHFDEVVFACHADVAYQLLEHPTALEDELLSPWRYKEGRLCLHKDHSSFPDWDLQQGFTFLYTKRNGELKTSVNGVIRHLNKVPKNTPYIGAQHPNYPVAPEAVEFDTVLRTPIFDTKAFSTVKRLPELNGKQRSYYCGSHFGHGLHEDAVASAVKVASMLGVEF